MKPYVSGHESKPAKVLAPGSPGAAGPNSENAAKPAPNGNAAGSDDAHKAGAEVSNQGQLKDNADPAAMKPADHTKSADDETAMPDATSPVAAKPKNTATSPALNGLTQVEATKRLRANGPNAVADVAPHPLRQIIGKFWAPVPWLLEAAIVLQLFLHDYLQAVTVFGLLTFNAVLGYLQSSRAQATLTALKSRLALSASVRRDGAWATVPAAALVQGDIIKLSLGGVVAADARLVGGEVLLDQSMLTGESLPIEAGSGKQTFAGALIKRGEAIAEVTATGNHTKFGRSAELIRGAHVVSTQQKAVLSVVRNLAIFNGVVVAALLIYTLVLHLSTAEIISIVLTAVLASIPVALPATFTLASAVGARALAAVGVLPTRLSAVDEAASMDVLCADKTGTLTNNALKVTAVHALPGFDEAHVLSLAAAASSEGGADPVDSAIRAAAATKSVSDLPVMLNFVPFDPTKKMSEALIASGPHQAKQRVIKGAFSVVSALAAHQPDATTTVNELQNKGYRVLAVAAGPPGSLRLAGLVALSDPPRADSAQLVKELTALGVRTVMVTGDAAATAAVVAAAVGLVGPTCPAGPLPDALEPAKFAVYAGVLPEDKFRLVQAFEKSGHVVGMCGDGANDAPALRQAQMGIAVATATDVAKSAAGIVLTTSGLSGIVAAVNEGRLTFQRILTYTLNSVVKKIVMVLLLAVGLIMTGHAVLTPMLMVVLMVVGDFLAMSLTTDNVRASPLPNTWRVGTLTVAGVGVGLCFLAFSSAVLAFGAFRLHLAPNALQTLAFISLAFGSQATIYAMRERRHLWSLLPSRWLVVSSLGDLAISTVLAVFGIFMAPLAWNVVASIFAAAIIFWLVLNLLKIPLFRRLKLS